MAAWRMQRRVLSLLANGQPKASLHKESVLSSANSFFRRVEFCKRIQTQAEPSQLAIEDAEKHENSSLKPNSNLEKIASNPTSDLNSAVRYSAVSNLKTSSRHDLAMIFTCKVCETRSVKTICRESYEKGVVVARCDGCDNLHLIADRLGWFGEPGSVEDFLAARGEEVKRGNVDSLSLTLEDLAGKQP